MHRIPTHLLFKPSVNKGKEENLLKGRGLGAKRMDELGVILNKKRTSEFFCSKRNAPLSASTQNFLSLI